VRVERGGAAGHVQRAHPPDRAVVAGARGGGRLLELALGDLVTTGAGEASLLFTLQLINARANLLGASRVLDDIALDKYTFVRDAYLQRRRSLVYDGEVPEEPSGDVPDAPAESASGVAK
jgi:hypothetical protein